MAWTVEQFGEFVAEFINGLDADDQKAITALVARLADIGNALRMPNAKPLGNGLFELRTSTGVRVFYTFRPGRRIVLLGGIVKKRDDIPATALRLMRQRARAAP